MSSLSLARISACEPVAGNPTALSAFRSSLMLILWIGAGKNDVFRSGSGWACFLAGLGGVAFAFRSRIVLNRIDSSSSQILIAFSRSSATTTEVEQSKDPFHSHVFTTERLGNTDDSIEFNLERYDIQRSQPLENMSSLFTQECQVVLVAFCLAHGRSAASQS